MRAPKSRLQAQNVMQRIIYFLQEYRFSDLRLQANNSFNTAIRFDVTSSNQLGNENHWVKTNLISACIHTESFSFCVSKNMSFEYFDKLA